MPDTPSLSPVVGEAQASPVERFRKRPLEVEMMLWDGTPERADELFAWTGGYFRTVNGGAEVYNNQEHGWIPCPLGHRVAQGALGEFYPVSPAAIAETFDPAPEPLELTPAEQAAVKSSLHMSTCHDQDCRDCRDELSTIRRVEKAVRPVIAGELLAEVYRLRRIVKDVIDLTRDTDGDYLHPDSEIPVGEIQRVLYDREPTDGIDSDGPPVAAASNPTPIPDGEE